VRAGEETLHGAPRAGPDRVDAFTASRDLVRARIRPAPLASLLFHRNHHHLSRRARPHQHPSSPPPPPHYLSQCLDAARAARYAHLAVCSLVLCPNGPRCSQGLGKGGAKRHRKILRDNIQGITKPAIRRLARRGGVKRISGLIYEETRGVLKIFLENVRPPLFAMRRAWLTHVVATQVIRDSVTYTEHAKRKTVTALDVVYALKRSGRTVSSTTLILFHLVADAYSRPALWLRCLSSHFVHGPFPDVVVPSLHLYVMLIMPAYLTTTDVVYVNLIQMRRLRPNVCHSPLLCRTHP
jgi:histone H4